MKAKFSSIVILKKFFLCGVLCSIPITFTSVVYAQESSVAQAAPGAPIDPAFSNDQTHETENDAVMTDEVPLDVTALNDPAATDMNNNMDASSMAASDSAVNAATAAEASTADAHNQYGLEALWAQGDVIARGTLLIMVFMSAATWYVLVTKLIQQQILLSQAKKTYKFWEKKELSEGMKIYKDDSAFRAVAEDGVLAVKQHAARSGEKIGLPEWLALQLQRSVERVSSQLQTGLSLLATVGSCSPFVGLFGTVWGIYHALIAIGLAGQASIDKVAGPVGEALIMTAIGLAVAVPAVLGYNWLVRRNKVIVESLRGFAADMHANLAMGVPGGQAN